MSLKRLSYLLKEEIWVDLVKFYLNLFGRLASVFWITETIILAFSASWTSSLYKAPCGLMWCTVKLSWEAKVLNSNSCFSRCRSRYLAISIIWYLPTSQRYVQSSSSLAFSKSSSNTSFISFKKTSSFSRCLEIIHPVKRKCLGTRSLVSFSSFIYAH